MEEPEKRYAVLTGDLVKSSAMSADEVAEAMATVRRAVALFAETFPGSVVGGADVFRGDGWQALLENPAMGLRLALFVRANLMAYRSADSKVSVGVGTVERIVEHKISESTGNAFEVSGYGLDALKRRQRMACNTVGAAVLLLDALVQQWTAKTAFAVAGALLGKTQEEISADSEEETTRQNIAKAFNRAGWAAIQAFLEEQESENKKQPL